MRRWRPQRFKQLHQDRANPEVLQNAIETGQQIVAINPSLSPVFSLRHLAQVTCTEYGFLRAVVSRRIDPYTIFRIRKAGKSSHEFRIICVPSPSLLKVQRWLLDNILTQRRPHESSFAFTKGTSVLQAAEMHCRCRWLIKLDVRRFFESISEISVYRTFRSFGYQPLVAFEMARLCTRVDRRYTRHRGNAKRWFIAPGRHNVILPYSAQFLGHLPQGAASSPALSNLAAFELDEAIADIAVRTGLTYTRYADDICLSTKANISRRTVKTVITEVYQTMSRVGLSPNKMKTMVSPPGARKLVLGLLVDGNTPALPREFRDRLRQHLYYLQRPNFGPARHAQDRGFASTIGLRNHIAGLISFAKQVDPEFGEKCDQAFAAVSWPI